MSARTYMPYIEGAMDHVKDIYRWNEEVDMMRISSGMIKFPTVEAYHKINGYDFNAGLRLYYEERGEYTTGKLEDNLLDQVDAIVDQFVVAVGEIRKCALADDYEHIAFWEERAGIAHIALRFDFATSSIHDAKNRCFTEVISKLFTRLGGDSYIDENGKFKKRSDFQEPDLSFLLK